LPVIIAWSRLKKSRVYGGRYSIASTHVLIEEMPQPAHHVHLNRPLDGILPLSITGVGLNALAFNALIHATV
jgi:hypothetical protein